MVAELLNRFGRLGNDRNMVDVFGLVQTGPIGLDDDKLVGSEHLQGFIADLAVDTQNLRVEPVGVSVTDRPATIATLSRWALAVWCGLSVVVV